MEKYYRENDEVINIVNKHHDSRYGKIYVESRNNSCMSRKCKLSEVKSKKSNVNVKEVLAVIAVAATVMLAGMGIASATSNNDNTSMYVYDKSSSIDVDHDEFRFVTKTDDNGNRYTEIEGNIIGSDLSDFDIYCLLERIGESKKDYLASKFILYSDSEKTNYYQNFDMLIKSRGYENYDDFITTNSSRAQDMIKKNNDSGVFK